tara:strand:+ start:542 stop:850 length:309 start_codon:yes stop_codon:yes gene_type:complete
VTKIFKYKFEDAHYKGIGVLQRWFGQKLSTSSKRSNKQLYKKVLNRLETIKGKQLYTTKEKIWLNNLRIKYMIAKAKEGYNFDKYGNLIHRTYKKNFGKYNN